MKKKIVLIQNNEVVLKIIDGILTDEGFDVTSSTTADPINDIDSINPDVIIVDDHLPGPKKGSEIISELKSDPQTENLSAVLTSTSTNLAQLSKDCKADDYIEKPFDIDRMVQVIRKNS
jgi:two-component system response regulator VicR